jgi:hypothetical protein
VAYFLAAVTARLDISAIASRPEQADAHMQATYHALILLKLLVNGCAAAIRSWH